MDSTPETMVHNGAQLFDAKIGEWYLKVNLETMDVASLYDCPLAQVFGGDYFYGLKALGLSVPEAIKLGLDQDDFREVSFSQLTHLWRLEITERITEHARKLVAEEPRQCKECADCPFAINRLQATRAPVEVTQ